MGEIVFAGFSPHPPVVLPEVGGIRAREVTNTEKAFRRFSKDIAASDPQALVIISPHAMAFRDAIAINMVPELRGSFAAFGAPHVRFKEETCLDLARAIIMKASQKGVPVVDLTDSLSGELDHGTMVPLYFIEKAGVKVPLVIISISLLSISQLYEFGKAVREAVEDIDKRVALIASGDLSHRLKPSAPAGYDEKGKEFDLKIKEYLEQNSFDSILKIPSTLAERAGECGLRPLVMLLGALDGYETDAEVLSYEGPFGVGYLVAEFKLSKANSSTSLHVQIARKSLETFLREGRYLESPKNLPEELRKKAGAFVSIKKKGKLRGCIGTVQPTRPTLCEEIIHNAVSAGIKDPRFMPVQLEELPELDFSVDVLFPPEPVDSLEELDPKKYGVIVRKGGRSGLLLPDLEGIDTPRQQVEIALQKAGISPNESYTLERFRVKRYH